MPDFNNLQITNSQYIPQYQGLPLNEIQQAGNVLQDRYYQNLAQANKIDLLNMQRMALEGDQGLNEELSREYDAAVKQLSEQGNYENLTGQVATLAKNYLGDKRRLYLEENFKRFQQDEQRAQDMRMKGIEPIGMGDPSAWSTIDPETGKPRLYSSNLQARLDYDKRMETLFNDVVSNTWGKDISQMSQEEQRQFAAGIAPYLKTGKVEAITDKRIKDLVETAMVRYKETSEYNQQTSILGRTDTDIEKQLVAVGRERVFSREMTDYLRDYTLDTSPAGGQPGGLTPPVFYNAGEDSTKYTENLLNSVIGRSYKELQNDPGFSPSGQGMMVGQGKLPVKDSEPTKGNFRLSLESTMDNLSKLPEGSIEAKTAVGYLQEYQDYMFETKGVQLSPTEIITTLQSQTIGETKKVEDAVRSRYENKMKQLSGQQVYKIGASKEQMTGYKSVMGLEPVSYKDGEPVFDSNIEFLKNANVVDKETGERMTMEGFMRGPADVDNWFEGERFEKEDYDKLKKVLGVGNTFSLPTSKSDFGLEVTVNDKSYILESPVQQNQDLSRLVQQLNNDLIDPTYKFGTGEDDPKTYPVVPGMEVSAVPGASTLVLSREGTNNVFYVTNTSGLALRPDGGVARSPEEAIKLKPHQVLRDYGHLFITNVTGERQYTPEGQYKDPRSK